MRDFGLRFRKRLAHLGGENDGEIVGMLHDQLVPAPQRIRALARGLRGPFCLCDGGPLDGRPRFVRAHIRKRRKDLPRRRIEHLERCRACAIGNGLEQSRIF